MSSSSDAYIHTYMHAYIHTCIHTYIHAYVPFYIHTYLPTYIHTYIPTILPSRSFTTSFVFPSFPVPAKTIETNFRKKLTCGVIRSFNFLGKTVRPGVKHLLEADLAWLLRLESQSCWGLRSNLGIQLSHGFAKFGRLHFQY